MTTPAIKAALRRNQDKKRAYVRDTKINKPCMDCGNTYPPECMDYDHRPGEIKRFDVSKTNAHGLPAIMDEIAKCDLICANCHRIRTTRRIRESGLAAE